MHPRCGTAALSARSNPTMRTEHVRATDLLWLSNKVGKLVVRRSDEVALQAAEAAAARWNPSPGRRCTGAQEVFCESAPGSSRALRIGCRVSALRPAGFRLQKGQQPRVLPHRVS